MDAIWQNFNRFLKIGLKSQTVVGCITLLVLVALAFPGMAAEEPSLTPQQALERLVKGNERFVKEKSLCPDRNHSRREALTGKQRPFAIILGCSDSRVPPEIAFDEGLGHLFVVRVAGNVVGDTELDSIEYSAIVNHSSIIVVLGHGSCGAVDAVYTNNTKDIESIADLIKPAVDDTHSTLEAAIEANVRNSVEKIKKSEPIADLMKAGKINVVGAYYDLKTGKITFMNK